MPTIGLDRLEKKIKVNKEKIKVVIYDTSGSKRFKNVVFKTIKNVDGIILVFDLLKRESFDNLNNWLDEINENLNNPLIILFGNRVDSDENEWKITSEDINNFLKEKRIPFFEISAKTGKGINEGFSFIINEAYDKIWKENLDTKKISINKMKFNKNYFNSK